MRLTKGYLRVWLADVKKFFQGSPREFATFQYFLMNCHYKEKPFVKPVVGSAWIKGTKTKFRYEKTWDIQRGDYFGSKAEIREMWKFDARTLKGILDNLAKIGLIEILLEDPVLIIRIKEYAYWMREGDSTAAVGDAQVDPTVDLQLPTHTHMENYICPSVELHMPICRTTFDPYVELHTKSSLFKSDLIKSDLTKVRGAPPLEEGNSLEDEEMALNSERDCLVKSPLFDRVWGGFEEGTPEFLRLEYIDERLCEIYKSRNPIGKEPNLVSSPIGSARSPIDSDEAIADEWSKEIRERYPNSKFSASKLLPLVKPAKENIPPRARQRGVTLARLIVYLAEVAGDPVLAKVFFQNPDSILRLDRNGIIPLEEASNKLSDYYVKLKGKGGR